MTERLEGRKFWKLGDRRHVWVVDAVEPATEGRPSFAILESEDGLASEEVDLARLLDPDLYTPVPMGAAGYGRPVPAKPGG